MDQQQVSTGLGFNGDHQEFVERVTSRQTAAVVTTGDLKRSLFDRRSPYAHSRWALVSRLHTMSSYAQYQPPDHAPPGHQPYNSGYQPAYQPGFSEPYAPSQLPNEAGYIQSWGDKKQEYGAPMEIKKKRVNDVVFLFLFILQVSSPS